VFLVGAAHAFSMKCKAQAILGMPQIELIDYQSLRS